MLNPFNFPLSVIQNHWCVLMIISSWKESERINRLNKCNSNMFWKTWKVCFELFYPESCQQNAEVGKWLAWEMGLELEHLSVCSSQNTNPLKSKRGKKYSMVKKYGKYYALTPPPPPPSSLEIYTIPVIKERPKKYLDLLANISWYFFELNPFFEKHSWNWFPGTWEHKF